LIGVVVMAVPSRYPEGLFDFVMGLNRWVWRVAAYAGLMRDEYPPFRLDAGGSDPGNPVPAPPPVPVGSGGARRERRWAHMNGDPFRVLIATDGQAPAAGGVRLVARL